MNTPDPDQQLSAELQELASPALDPKWADRMSDAEIEALLDGAEAEPFDDATEARIIESAVSQPVSEKIVRPVFWRLATVAAVALVLGSVVWWSKGWIGSSEDETVAPSISSTATPSIAPRSQPQAPPTNPEPEFVGPRARPPAALVPIAEQGTQIVTGAGERRRVSLADGTVLSLNEESKVVLLGDRRIRLESGEAFLEVSPFDGDAEAGTFLVETPGRQVTALGTKFAVRVDGDETGVLVTQGKVRASGIDGTIAAGQQLVASRREPAPNAAQALAWMEDLVKAAETPLVPSAEHAGGALIVKDANGQAAKLELRGVHVDVHIEDGFARTTIDQTYFNHMSRREEGTFYFPLPPDASLSRLAMYVAGKLMEGGMAEREHARQVFETIKYKKLDPALLEWVDGSTFKMRVFPLEPREEKRVLLSYTQRLDRAGGEKLRYRFPAGHNMEQTARWSAQIRVADGAGAVWKSGSHDFDGGDDGADLLLAAEADRIAPEDDIVFEFEDKAALKGESRLAKCHHEGRDYLSLRLMPELPKAPQAKRRDWVFLLEVSADRDPLLARTAVDLVTTMLDHAGHDDTFTLITANTHIERFRGGAAQPANAKTAKEATGFMNRMHLIGALDLHTAFGQAAELSAEREVPVVVHLGSGIASLGERAKDALVAALPEGVPYVGIGVGKRWNRDLMRRAAAQTGGYFTQVNPDESAKWRGFEIVSALNTPRLLELDVEGAPFLLAGDAIGDGEELFAVARLPEGGALPKSVVVTGQLEGEPWRREIEIGQVQDGAGYLPRIWAKFEIDRLVADNGREHRAEIVALSKAMYVMSPFTSLLVLENDAMYTQYGVDRGRKDHWALYPAPVQIEVVREPMVATSPANHPTLRPQPKPRVLSPTKGGKKEPLKIYRHSPLPRSVFGGEHLAPEFSTDSIAEQGRRLERARVEMLDIMEKYNVVDLSLGSPAWLRGGQPDTGIGNIVMSAKRREFDARAALQDLRTTIGALRNLSDEERIEAAVDLGIQNPTLTARYPEFRNLQLTKTQLENSGLSGGHPQVIAVERQIEQVQALLLGAVDNAESALSTQLRMAEVTFENSLRTKAREESLSERRQNIRYIEAKRAYELQKARYANMTGNGITPLWNSDSDAAGGIHGTRAGGIIGAIGMDRRGPTGVAPSVDMANLRFYPNLYPDLMRSDAVGHHFGSSDIYYNGWGPGDRWGTGLIAPNDSDGEPLGGKTLAYDDWSQAFTLSHPTVPGHSSYRPAVESAPVKQSFFADLVAFAPGLDSSDADALALHDDARGDIESGAIDKVARILIERARGRGWQRATLPDGSAVTVDGGGRFWAERVTGHGLTETTVCDGETLRHLYREIGLGAERSLSRHHAAEVQRAIPWLVPTAETLAYGAEIRLLGANQIAVVPLDVEVPLEIRWKFDPIDGMATERMVWHRKDDKAVGRVQFERGGVVRWLAKDGKELKAHDFGRKATGPPNLKPDLSELVVLPLPLLAKDSVADGTPLERLAGSLWRDSTMVHSLIELEFFAKDDRRIGFYTLLAAHGRRTAGDRAIEHHPDSALAAYLDDQVGVDRIGLLLSIPTDVDDGFIDQLSLARAHHIRLAAPGGHNEGDVEAALIAVKSLNSDSLSIELLQRARKSATTTDERRAVRAAFERFADNASYSESAAYARAELAWAAGDKETARREFIELIDRGFEAGAPPHFGAALVEAVGIEADKPFLGERSMRYGERWADEGKVQRVISLALQHRAIGKTSDVGTLLEDLLLARQDKLDEAWKLPLIRHFTSVNRPGDAATILRSLLSDDRFNANAELWRDAHRLSVLAGDAAGAVRALDEALHLEFGELEDEVELHWLRTEFGELLARFSSTAATDPDGFDRDLRKRFIRAADRWRSLDTDPTIACGQAAAVCRAAGDRRLAWRYLTTPLALRPNESAPWLALAKQTATHGDPDTADLAYHEAFRAEGTNAQILVDHAAFLEGQNRAAEARELYQQVADKDWGPQYRSAARTATSKLRN